MTESDTCFIGNLDDAVGEEGLEAFLEGYNHSEIRMPPMKGFAFVQFESNEAAAKAQTELNGKELKNKALRIALAAPRGAGGGR